MLVSAGYSTYTGWKHRSYWWYVDASWL